MPMEVNLDAVTRERLEEQSRLLLRIYEAEFAKDPTSLATESSRSNMIAFRHSIEQVYGNAAALDMADVLDCPLELHPLRVVQQLYSRQQ